MAIKNFKEYFEENIARKIKPNLERAYSLIDDSNNRKEFLERIIKNMEITDENANFFIEPVYDTLISLVRAKMFIDGFMASGNYAHEAEVSYLRELKFLEIDISMMNELRQFRNGIKYYGEKYKKQDAKEAISFLNIFLPKLLKILGAMK